MSEEHEQGAPRHGQGFGQDSADLPRLLGAGAGVDDDERMGGGKKITIRGHAVGLGDDREDFDGRRARNLLPDVGFDLHDRECSTAGLRYQDLMSMNIVKRVRVKRLWT
jgi:hypothetical protein